MAACEYSKSVFTDEEIEAFYETKRLLLENPKYNMTIDKMEHRTLFITVMTCKLRPEKAAAKYSDWLKVLNEFNIHSFNDFFTNLLFADDESNNKIDNVNNNNSSLAVKDVNVSKIDSNEADINQLKDDLSKKLSLQNDESLDFEKSEKEWKLIVTQFDKFAPAGKDNHDRNVMWIRTGDIPVEAETIHVRAQTLLWLALHSDLTTMRNGLMLILDTSTYDMVQKHGNEKKLLRYRQYIPLRPQTIIFLGITFFKRIIVNAALAFVSLFQTEKVADRIKFGDYNDILAAMPVESIPVYTGLEGARGGGKESIDDIVHWVKQSIKNMPTLPPFDQ